MEQRGRPLGSWLKRSLGKIIGNVMGEADRGSLLERVIEAGGGGRC